MKPQKNRTEAENQIRADPRYSELPQPCQHCKHIISMGNQFEPEGWTCKAFPEQILYRILTLREHHTQPNVSQVGDFVFDPVIYTESDTGRQWHYNADASWQYVHGV